MHVRTVVMTPISNCLSESSLRTELKIFVCSLSRDYIGLFDASLSRDEVHLICKSLPKGSSEEYDLDHLRTCFIW